MKYYIWLTGEKINDDDTCEDVDLNGEQELSVAVDSAEAVQRIALAMQELGVELAAAEKNQETRR